MIKKKLLIAGIGGVGGYIGGILAKNFINDDFIEIYFFARGKHLAAIKNKGLKILHHQHKLVVHPKLVTDNPDELGVLDYIIVCCKSYDLEALIAKLHICLSEKTIILPLLNGVESAEKLNKLAPNSKILNGSIYIVSYIKEAGIIENKGNIERIFLGSTMDNKTYALDLANILKLGKLDAILCDNIEEIIWEKFYMISANSTATSYFMCSVGELFSDVNKFDFLVALLHEVDAVAKAKGIYFKENMIDQTILKLKSLPVDTTSSMQRDFLKNDGKTELEGITGYLVNVGKELKIETSAFNEAYEKLLIMQRTPY
jgi:2-dehydropantoate 2-reductase